MPDWEVAWSLPAGSGGRWAAEYESGRPGWPPEVLERLDLPVAATVLDLAAGTGKVTRLLTPTYRRVIAIEPEAAMRRVLRMRCPGVDILEASADAIPLREASVDGIFVGEAFHLFGGERVVAEFARVLRPGGTLTLLFNVPGGAWEPSLDALEQFLRERLPQGQHFAYDPLDLNHERISSGRWREAFSGSAFGEFQHRELTNPQALDREGVVAFFASMGWILELPDEEREPLVNQVRAQLDAEVFRRVWTTHVYWTSTSVDQSG